MKLLLVVFSACLTAQGMRGESVETILARMDEASQTFKAMSADVRMTTFTKVINDTSVENGTPIVALDPIGGDDPQGSNVAMALVEGLEFVKGTIDVKTQGILGLQLGTSLKLGRDLVEICVCNYCRSFSSTK